MKTFEKKHSIASGHGLSGGELRWCRPRLPADDARWMGAQARMHMPPQARAQASPISPSAMGKVDGAQLWMMVRRRRAE
jgi:hypothetical protein